MAIGSLLVPGVNIPRPDHSWLGSIADSLGGAIQDYKADKSFSGLADRLQGGAAPAQQGAGGFLAGLAPQAPQAPQTAPVTPVARGQMQGDTYEPFINTVKTGIDRPDGSKLAVTNPYALAAVASTGKAESGWSAKNANRTWSDPSESGKPGTAGGVMSWRGPRYEALAATGDLSPEGQAKFFLQENPELIQKLNNAGSVEEAQQLMNNAWAFAGYDRPGGESARRLAMAQNYYANEFGNGGGEQMEQGDAAPAPYRDPMVSVQNGSAPQAQDQSRYTMASPTAPGGGAPMQVAGDANPQIAAGVTPVQRGSVDPSIIQYMLRDKNLRETGLKLWAANSQGQKPTEAWQFVNLPDGTLARANQQTGAVERLGNFAKPNQDAVTVGDNLVNRTTGEVIYEGKPKTPASYQEFQLAKETGFQGTYADWEKVKVPGTSVTVNNGEGDKFYENLDKKNAEMFSTLSDTGMQARSKMAQIDRLEGLMANAPQGAVGAMKQIAGEFGIPTEGLSDIQAASALLEKMVPEQRAPGSGPMSDADIKMFRASLPRVINQPGGNQIIFDTMRGIAQYESQMGEIADAVADRSMTPAQARKAIRELENPLASFKAPSGPTPNGGVKAGDVEDGYRFKGGSRSDPNNWEKVQ